MDCSGRCCIFVYKFSSLQTMKFTHFHVHSQYSILDGAASIPGLIEKAKADGQAALALTDHGNMFGIKLFYDTCRQKGIKPILGCEAYVARVSLYNKEKPIDRSGEHLIILAKTSPVTSISSSSVRRLFATVSTTVPVSIKPSSKNIMRD